MSVERWRKKFEAGIWRIAADVSRRPASELSSRWGERWLAEVNRYLRRMDEIAPHLVNVPVGIRGEVLRAVLAAEKYMSRRVPDYKSARAVLLYIIDLLQRHGYRQVAAAVRAMYPELLRGPVGEAGGEAAV